MTAAAQRTLWDELVALAARRERRLQIMQAHAGDALPRCVPRRRRDDLRDKVIYPTADAARGCCEDLAAELGESNGYYRCLRRRTDHWHLTSR